jgi:hypothetical protein
LLKLLAINYSEENPMTHTLNLPQVDVVEELLIPPQLDVVEQLLILPQVDMVDLISITETFLKDKLEDPLVTEPLLTELLLMPLLPDLLLMVDPLNLPEVPVNLRFKN